MAGLVHGLGGGVELRVHVGNDLDDLGRAHQRTLLAVQELREVPGRVVLAELSAAGFVGGLPGRAAEQRMELVGHPTGFVGSTSRLQSMRDWASHCLSLPFW